MAVALKRQNVRGKPVKKEAIVADNHGAACETFQSILQRAQGFHVQIVGRLIEQQHIAAFFQHLSHMYAVAFTAR